jgi:hypothetical protein
MTTSTSTAPAIEAPTATIYHAGGFGSYQRTEAKNVRVWFAPYAQYTRAIFCEFTPKGKRKPVRLVQTYRPTLVIFAGACSLEPAPMLGEELTDSPLVTVRRSAYSSCDPRWTTDFLDTLARYLDDHPAAHVLANFHDFHTSAG